jgi:hypothetical protein
MQFHDAVVTINCSMMRIEQVVSSFIMKATMRQQLLLLLRLKSLSLLRPDSFKKCPNESRRLLFSRSKKDNTQRTQYC